MYLKQWDSKGVTLMKYLHSDVNDPRWHSLMQHGLLSVAAGIFTQQPVLSPTSHLTARTTQPNNNTVWLSHLDYCNTVLAGSLNVCRWQTSACSVWQLKWLSEGGSTTAACLTCSILSFIDQTFSTCPVISKEWWLQNQGPHSRNFLAKS